MTDKKNCPQCKKDNKLSAKFCLNCGFEFPMDKSNSSSDSDWLSFLRQSDEESGLNLISLEGVDKEIIKNDDDTKEVPDWLNRIREIKQTEDEFTKIQSGELSYTEIENADLIDTLREEEKSTEKNSDDWITKFRDISPTQENDQIDEAEPEPNSIDESSPISSSLDEIKNVWQKEFPALHENIENSEIEPADELPEWLNKTIFDNPEKSEKADDFEMPNWLTPDQEPAAEEILKSDESINIPDWLSQSNFLIEDASEHDTSDELSESLPEWIKEIEKHKTNQKLDGDIEDSEISSNSKDEFDSVLLFNKLDIFPDDSEEENEKQDDHQYLSESASKEINNEAAFIFDDKELINIPTQPFIGFDASSEWFDQNILENEDDKNEEVETEDENSPKKSPFVFDNIPDWLENVDLNFDDIEPTEATNDEIISDSNLSENIIKAELPEWLRSIRPIEVVTPEISRLQPQKIIEKSGPLAGLQGALSSEKATKLYSAPPAYSVSINITDKQRTHIKILEDIISPSKIKDSSGKTKNTLIQRFTTQLIPIFLLIIVLSSLFLDHSGQKFPELLSADTVRFFNLSTGYLNRNQTPGNVLVVFETDASTFPEMSLISSGFFDNLFMNNHWITLISTNPNGVLVADEILNNSRLKVPSYNYSERIINLGYLPGNAIGIQSFLTNPKATIPEGLSNPNIWNEPPLSDINSMLDFDLIVLVSDNSDNAKLWIEQVDFLIPDIGFLLISTTQASPLLQPYLRSNQIDGMINGISGGISYNLLSNSESNVLDRYWAIIQVVAITFIVFLLAGGVLSIFKNTLSANSSGDKK
jgi:hypothetical protein